MPNNDQTTTSTSRAMVPKNLRVRMVMTQMCISPESRLCAREAADYKGRENSIKRGVDDGSFRTTCSVARHQMVAVVDRRPDRRDGAGRRRHPADRIRVVDRRVE